MPHSGPKREQGLVLEPLVALTMAALRLEQPLAADRAGGAAVPAAEIVFGERFSAQGVGIFERRLLEVAGGQRAQTVEHGQVGNGSDDFGTYPSQSRDCAAAENRR